MASKKNSGTGRSALRLSDVARLGLTGLRARPMRAILSALGIAIGIAAMVGVVGVSASSQARLQEQLRALGTNMLTARSGADLSGTDLILPEDSVGRTLMIPGVTDAASTSTLSGVSALDNVADGLLYRGVPRAKRREAAREALTRVGLGHRMDHKPHQMSGGERQRVAIARAIIGHPALLLADEPTGNLDSRSGASIVALLRELNEAGTTIIVITHDNDLAASLPRQIAIRDGEIVSDSAHPGGGHGE